MKKTLLIGGLMLTAYFTQAQQRLALYEEFSGENCAPCAATNPGLNAILDANANTILLKYQSPIPSAGPIYNQNTTDVQNRMTYYGVSFAPYGRLDGAVSPGAPSGSSSAGHPGYLTAAHLTAEAAIASPFTITVTNTVTGTSATPTINITAVSGYTGTNVKLRVALVEDLSYATPPGTNGETEFHHVLRKFLGTGAGDGKAISNTWTAGQTLSVTDMTAAIPSYVDRTHNVFYIVWIQDDGTKAVAQAAKSANLPAASLDATVFSMTPENGKIFCGTPTITHTVKLKNTGTTPITSVNIYTKYGTGAYLTPQAYTTAIAAGATTGDITITAAVPAGTTSITDSVGYINSSADLNPANNVLKSDIAILSSGGSLPVNSSFEAATLPSGYIVLDKNGGSVADPVFDGETWFTHSESGITAYDGSYTAIADASAMDAGATTIIAFPYTAAPTGAKAVDFAYAYAQRGTIAGDKLEVVYSADCGQTWTSVWSKASADLATASATGSSSLFFPTSTSQWRTASVDVSAANGNVLVGFRATSAQGNLIYIDKAAYRTGAPTVGIEEVLTGGQFSLYPNPVNDFVNVELNLTKKSEVSFTVVNVLGQQVGTTTTKTLNPGQNITQISTSSLANGIYFMNVTTEKGSIQQKFVKH